MSNVIGFASIQIVFKDTDIPLELEIARNGGALESMPASFGNTHAGERVSFEKRTEVTGGDTIVTFYPLIDSCFPASLNTYNFALQVISWLRERGSAMDAEIEVKEVRLVDHSSSYSKAIIDNSLI